MVWVLLIYTVPSEPSRKRASIWRELKKIGAVYVRDGVCALPERDRTVAALRTIAAKVEEFGGQATLVESARLSAARGEEIVARLRSDRAGEYADISRDAERLLRHLRREIAHRNFTVGELTALGEDLGKLRRWMDQVRMRDYFDGEESGRVAEMLARCEEELAPLTVMEAVMEAVPRHSEVPR